MGLFQKGPNGEERTGVEHTVFKKSLSNMMEGVPTPRCDVQAHEAPQGLPDSFKFTGMEPNLADYEDRYRLHLSSLSFSPLTQDAVSNRGCALRVVSRQPDQGLTWCSTSASLTRRA